MTAWTQEEHQDAVDLRAQGETHWDIAAILNAKYRPEDDQDLRSASSVRDKLARKQSGRGWTEEQVGELTQRVENRESAAQIARMMDKTRNAIIGKCRRMEITLKGARWPDDQIMPKIIHSSEKPIDPGTTVKGIPDRLQCKYPIEGIGAETIYCANRRTDKSYCNTHQNDCYQSSWY